MSMGFIEHFFPCISVSLADQITGQTIVGAVSPVVGDAPNSINFKVSGTNGSLSGAGWSVMGDADMVMMVAGRAIDHTAEAGKPSIGNISFYMGDPGNNHYRIQPYLSGVNSLHTTKDYYPLVNRRAGVDYIFALVRRGKYLEHYVYDDLLDDFLLTYILEESLENPFSNVHDNYIQVGHSSSGFPTGNISTVSDQPQDFYGFLVAHFPYGAPAPDEIIAAMQFHLNDQTGWKSPYKAIYEPWLNGEYGMSDDKTVVQLASVTQLVGNELLYTVSGSADKNVTPERLREYLSVPWKGRNPSGNIGITSCICGNVQATNASIIGSVNVFHFVPFILTAEQALAGFTNLTLKFQGNSGSSVNRLHVAVYDALTDTLLGEASRAVTPNTNTWASISLPTIATWPRQVYIGISSGINGGAGADCSTAEGLLMSFPGYKGEANIAGNIGLSSACGFIIADSWNSAPALNGLAADATSVSKMPFLIMI